MQKCTPEALPTTGKDALPHSQLREVFTCPTPEEEEVTREDLKLSKKDGAEVTGGVAGEGQGRHLLKSWGEPGRVQVRRALIGQLIMDG
eukprot:CAMPEP_0196598170 /NCGR_PEP_ID=MMETSP1081-20130531/94166_1 /TAXON_ID=36882 /ORGANISM="Pyramimonas amylifera, Strain CCMP720" /LENGTH=88 /DNA_ID=CAMNT_0041923825 /DNA_START=1748 /DNA_END=2011 /DNA_ORIENTATION=+